MLPGETMLTRTPLPLVASSMARALENEVIAPFVAA